jgi:mannosyltransferase
MVPYKTRTETVKATRDYTPHLLALLIVTGIALRFYHLDFNSLWLDEAATLSLSNVRVLDIWTRMASGGEVNPPLFYILEHFMIQMFGTSEWVLRFLPAVFGVLTIPAIYLTGKEFWNKQVGLVAAGLVTFSPFLIYYSQEARAYSFVLLLCTGLMYFFLKAMKSNEPQDWTFFGVIAAIAIYTHFNTLSLIGALTVYILIMKRKDPVAVFFGIVSWIALCIPIGIVFYKIFSERIATAPTFGMKGLDLIIRTFTEMGGYDSIPVQILIFLFILGMIVLWVNKDKSKAVLITWILGVIIAASIFLSYKMPMMPRYLIILAVPLYLGIAMSSVGFTRLFSERHNQTVLAVLVLLIAVIAVPYYTQYYTYYSKEDWRGIGKDLQKIQGDVVVVPGYIKGPLGYYYSSPLKEATTVDELTATPHGSYYIVTGDIQSADPSGKSVQWLNANTRTVKNYGGIYLLKGV